MKYTQFAPSMEHLSLQIQVEDDGLFVIGRCAECHKQVAVSWGKDSWFEFAWVCEHTDSEPELNLIDHDDIPAGDA